MQRSPAIAVTAGIGGGLLNVIALQLLFLHGRYPVLGEPTELGVVLASGFAVGFFAAFVTLQTRLYSPLVSFLALLGGTVAIAIRAPRPDWSELQGYTIVEGPTHAGSYADAWGIWIALLAVLALFEFGVRRGFGLREDALSGLPTLPLSNRGLAWLAGTPAVLVGVAAVVLVRDAGLATETALLGILPFATTVTIVPLLALLGRGIVSPALAYLLTVPSTFLIEVFTTPESPVHFLLFGPLAVGFVGLWALEELFHRRSAVLDRSRFLGSPATESTADAVTREQSANHDGADGGGEEPTEGDEDLDGPDGSNGPDGLDGPDSQDHPHRDADGVPGAEHGDRSNASDSSEDQ